MELNLQTAKENRQESDERKELIDKYNALTSQKNQLVEALDEWKENDPAVLELKKKEIKTAKDAANRWFFIIRINARTDNIFILQSFCNSRFMMDFGTFCQ